MHRTTDKKVHQTTDKKVHWTTNTKVPGLMPVTGRKFQGLTCRLDLDPICKNGLEKR